MADKNKKYDYPEAIVGVLIINNEDKLLFCKTPKWKGKYSIFGGHVEYEESMEDAAIREAKEETGLDVEVVSNIGISNSIFNRNFHEKKHFIFLDFLCRYAGGNDEIKINGEYENKYTWVSMEETKKLDLADGSKLILEEYTEYKNKKGNLEGWKRCQADFENYKKRQETLQWELAKYSGLNLILQILPVLDNFHASTDHIPAEQKETPWVVGIMYIQKQLEKILEDNGVKEIETKEGDDFDPKIHEALKNGEQEKNKKSQNKIVKVVLKGYKMEKKVIRAAGVIVE
ncbi:nucleotide exchange factor GrpE [Patescibacteria group bacterium]|nr:nucleotide exchange factor GrpE [Patescibacteria group bacterium]